MIQVLERAVGVLELLAREEPLTLAALCERTGLKKPTLCLILKSLVELGCARKADTGLYATGPKLLELAFLPRKRQTVQSLAEEAAAGLAEEIHESTVAAVAYNGTRYTIAQASRRQALMVDTRLQARGNFYSNATGRVLLAFMGPEEAAEIIERDGLPSKAEWPEATSRQRLGKQLDTIRHDGSVAMSVADGAIVFVSTPVIGPDDKGWAALGVSLPASRYTGAHKTQVMKALQNAACAFADQLRLTADRKRGRESFLGP